MTEKKIKGYLTNMRKIY